jgi:hypothetical protein
MTISILTMSAACYEITTRPGVENGEIPAPGWRKVGKGSQAVWPFDPVLLDTLWWRVVDIYDGSDGWHDEDVARDRAVMKAWLDRYHSITKETQK